MKSLKSNSTVIFIVLLMFMTQDKQDKFYWSHDGKFKQQKYRNRRSK